MRRPQSDGVPVRAVSRAMQLLSGLTTGPQHLATLAARAELSKATASRLLATLEMDQLVIQDSSTGQYSLGPGCFQFAEAISGGASGLELVAKPELDRLREESGETATLHVRIGGQRICVAELPSPHPIRYTAGIGAAAPIHTGSAGKVLLAFLDDTGRAELLRLITLEPRTPATITDRSVLQGELDRVRVQGWAESYGERIDGAVAVSAPVFDGNDRILAALSVLGPASRLNSSQIRGLAPLVTEQAGQITGRLRQISNEVLSSSPGE
ncbi:MAG: helix-turn-helix domain-containing protein [Pseudonocardiaceae bacterium]|nr:helix-turn-helix domain-containing protein [Pseudonocardiaceae bacterium]